MNGFFGMDNAWTIQPGREMKVKKEEVRGN